MKLGAVGFSVFLAFAPLAGPLGAEAQQPEKVVRIGYLSAGLVPLKTAETLGLTIPKP